MALKGSAAWDMAGLESIKVIAHFQVWHAHHPLHQLLAMGVEAFATLEGFDQQLKQLSFGGCAGHGLLLPLVWWCSNSIGKS
ncbi:MAG: hypothetical protein EBT52_08380 [Flavobacteriia bacterium]|nr:hypothetical protein [Flavobacteriia bacterium]